MNSSGKTPSIRASHRILLWFLMVQLLISAAYAFQFTTDLGGKGATKLFLPLEQTPLQAWTEYTGVDKNYGFYAPKVGTDVRIRYVVHTPDEMIQEPFSMEGANLEARIRASAMVSAFARAEEFQDFGSMSMAAFAFGRHPKAKEVEVIVEVMDTPSIREWRKGERMDWLEIYRGAFAPR